MGDEVTGHEDEIRIIKKYPNRRIYDTQESKYIKVENIRDMIVEGIAFVVLDSKTGEDVTRTVLLQLIIEQESENNPLFTTENLKTFIRYYGQGPHQPFAEFMDQSLSFFKHQQEQLSEIFSGVMDHAPMKAFTEMSKINKELREKMSDNFYNKK
jgi:polyhydroxyalkanoate synthesis repressor PhaR